LWWGETKEGDAVGGARLTIEIGAEFPIGISLFNTLGTPPNLVLQASTREAILTRFGASSPGWWSIPVRLANRAGSMHLSTSTLKLHPPTL
ncbi:MAG: hypothetical protein ACXVBG_21885, partial [Isosphaeraceae bacterium]